MHLGADFVCLFALALMLQRCCMCMPAGQSVLQTCGSHLLQIVLRFVYTISGSNCNADASSCNLHAHPQDAPVQTAIGESLLDRNTKNCGCGTQKV